MTTARVIAIKYGYKYEIHSHTKETSACSRMTGSDLVRFYADLGFTGIFVSDHFFNGNTTVPRSGLKWDERVDLFMKGYESARSEGERLGIDVFFAWEYSYRGADFLTYGLDEVWLRSHPDVTDWPVGEYLTKVREQGAFVVHAHPFRQASYIPMIHLMPDKIDAVEADNASMTPEVNTRADWYADSYREYNLLKVSGSDTHFTERPRFAGMAFSYRLKSVTDFIASVRNGEYERFSVQR